MDKLDYIYIGPVRNAERQHYAQLMAEIPSGSTAETMPQDLPQENLEAIEQHIADLKVLYADKDITDPHDLFEVMSDSFAECIRWWEEPWRMDVEWVVFRKILSRSLKL